MADMANNISPFIPWQSVGIFEIGRDIHCYQFDGRYWDYYPIDNFGDESYRATNDTMSIYFRHGKINKIFCYDNLTYHGTNLIGLSIDEFTRITNCDYMGEPSIEDFEEDGYPQTVYEFEDIGAQVWEKQGKIVCIIVAGKDSYSDEPYEE